MHRVDDARAVIFDVAGDDVDLVGEVLDVVFVDAGVEQQRAAELDLIAAGELGFADLLSVDERAVGAAQIAEQELVAAATRARRARARLRCRAIARSSSFRARSSPWCRRVESACP